jgi:hypothetical protein
MDVMETKLLCGGRIMIGTYDRLQYDHDVDLKLCYGFLENRQWSVSWQRPPELLPTRFGVMFDKSDGGLFRYVRQLGIRLPYWKRQHKTYGEDNYGVKFPQVEYECEINETAMIALMLAL